MSMTFDTIQEYTVDTCHVTVPLRLMGAANAEIFRYVDYIKDIFNCEVFIDQHNFLIYVDTVLFTCKSNRRFNMENLKELIIHYKSDGTFTLDIPLCTSPPYVNHKVKLNFLNLRNITEICQLKINNHLSRFKPNFTYGYVNKYNGCPDLSDVLNETMPILKDPQLCCPLTRKIKRESMEMLKFNKENYQKNLLDINHPVLQSIDFEDTKLTDLEVHVLKTINENSTVFRLPQTKYAAFETNNGLLNILFAICFDVRCNGTNGESLNQESAWNRCVLSATLSFYDSFHSIKECIVSFLRRCLTYPKVLNYEIAKLCVEDTYNALKYHPEWILKQLLVTNNFFTTSSLRLISLNRYYIRDYIRYFKYCCGLNNETVFYVMAQNLKNVYLDIQKADLRLGLPTIDIDFLKQLVNEVNALNEVEDCVELPSAGDDLEFYCIIDECEELGLNTSEVSSDDDDFELFWLNV